MLEEQGITDITPGRWIHACTFGGSFHESLYVNVVWVSALYRAFSPVHFKMGPLNTPTYPIKKTVPLPRARAANPRAIFDMVVKEIICKPNNL